MRIKDGNGKDAVVTLPSVEDALFRLEKDIVRDTELFGEKMVGKLLTRYDRRLECERTVNGAVSVGMPIRDSIKTRQLELSRDILTVRFGMSAEKIDFLDRDLAKQLATQAVKDNLSSGPALDALYDKIASQKHLVDVDMLSLYKALDADPLAGQMIHLPEPKPQFDPGAGRPTEVPPVISNFQSSQERLTVAMESMLRTMTNAEVARLDVILAAARKDGFDVGEIGGGDDQASAPKERRFVEIWP